MKKNILHVVNIYFALPYFIGDQFLYFSDKGYKMHVICSPTDQINKYSKEKKFSYKEVNILRSISIFEDVKSIVSIYRYIKREDIDIVVGHTPKGALLSMIASYLAHVPKRIYFRHGLVYETANGVKRKLLIFIDRLTSNCATQIVCVSPSVFNRSLDDRLNPRNKQIILSNGTCNGIDTNRFSQSAISNDRLSKLREELAIPQNAFVIGFTGRLVRDKGIVELVKSFELLCSRYDNLYLLLVGMIDDRDTISVDMISKIKENNRIVHTGLVNNNQIEYYYGLMNVFTLLSYREGFPTSVLEASSMELPIITTKATGCIDSIVENRTGVFVGHDIADVANVIENFIVNKPLCSEFGREGRKFVVNYFDQKVIWECIEELYNN